MKTRKHPSAWFVPVGALVAALGGADLPASDEGSRWRAHVAYLADDRLEGRETGGKGHRMAAEYVADELERSGLTPVGASGFLQSVRFRWRRIVEEHSKLELVRSGGVLPLVLGDDAVFNLRVDAAPRIEAPLVFVGYGLTIPELGHDDFAGLNAERKIVVYLSGVPAGVSSALGAHYQSAGERWAAMKRAGALGAISIQNPGNMDVPWTRSAPNRLRPALSLSDPALDDTHGQQLAVTFNPAKAESLFEGSPFTFAQLLTLADSGAALPRFDLRGSLRAELRVERRELESHNVLGVVRGTDRRLRNEYVVLTAHLDHLGIGAPIDGDRVYNGAMDNAAGVATLIESARMLARKPARRSVLFVALTAEESGLLGSRFFVAHPPVDRRALVANLNLDMFLPLVPFRRLLVFGLRESDLERDVNAVAESMGLAVQDDPEPLRNRFIRSDQYNFVRAGVPAVALKVGYEPDSESAAVMKAWTRERYHAPSDDMNQPFDLEAAVGFTRAVSALCLRTADRETRPAWMEGSFFRRFAAPAR